MSSRVSGAADLPEQLATPAETAAADRRSAELGVPLATLMERAGSAVAEHCRRVLADTPGLRRVLMLCGRGHNGGDGYVAARLLEAAGIDVTVAAVADPPPGSLAGKVAGMFNGRVIPLDQAEFDDPAQLIVDGLLGGGLDRPVDGSIGHAIGRLNAAGAPVLAIDIPSGIDGATGDVRGIAVEADWTVTFERRKPGHLLFPGRRHAGKVWVASIGVPDAAYATTAAPTFRNTPALWTPSLWRPGALRLTAESHKYSRGHVVVVSGGLTSTGAARLAARAALRVGAGLVTLASPADAVAINAGQLTAIMVAEVDSSEALSVFLEDKRRNNLVIGPGCGLTPKTRAMVLAALASPARVVIDADGLTAFAGDREVLFAAIKARTEAGERTVLTPHPGEFARLFPHLSGCKLSLARDASALSGATVLLKGADTVIAAPDGRAAINDNAPPALATAGSGDVLAGLIGGLMAQGLGAFEASAAAAWMHGEAANRFGPGLIAEDLPETMPQVIVELVKSGEKS